MQDAPLEPTYYLPMAINNVAKYMDIPQSAEHAIIAMHHHRD